MKRKKLVRMAYLTFTTFVIQYRIGALWTLTVFAWNDFQWQKGDAPNAKHTKY